MLINWDAVMGQPDGGRLHRQHWRWGGRGLCAPCTEEGLDQQWSGCFKGQRRRQGWTGHWRVGGTTRFQIVCWAPSEILTQGFEVSGLLKQDTENTGHKGKHTHQNG